MTVAFSISLEYTNEFLLSVCCRLSKNTARPGPKYLLLLNLSLIYNLVAYLSVMNAM